ncbi:hypothetical protein CAMRE0001_0563 [Campylobacter rectus RM3267]|uniref:Uncharacterized protein n=1 Tax=Campylobacter rectus RM3267 TaxID=553218 RepID=B9D594_CAMRE|nr:hypothetical protein CAMRE0001_0563 [Campylobacter rectus RM3267]
MKYPHFTMIKFGIKDQICSKFILAFLTINFFTIYFLEHLLLLL